MKKVLIIEDNELLGTRAEATVRSLGFETTWVTSLGEAEEAIPAGGYDAVVLDACLGGNQPNTLHLIQLMRGAGHQGPIIANSAIDNELLMQAGCTHANKKLKPFLQEVFREAGLIE